MYKYKVVRGCLNENVPRLVRENFIKYLLNDRSRVAMRVGTEESYLQELSPYLGKYKIIKLECEDRYLLDNGRHTYHINHHSISGEPYQIDSDFNNFLESSVFKAFSLMKELNKFTISYLCGSFVINELHGLGDSCEDIDFACYPYYYNDDIESTITKLLKDKFNKDFYLYNYADTTTSLKIDVGAFELNLLFKGKSIKPRFDDFRRCLSSYDGFFIMPLNFNFQAKVNYGRQKDFAQLAKIAADVIRPSLEYKESKDF